MGSATKRDGRVDEYKPGTTDLEPYLAESYEIQDNGKVYVFHLRKDLKFADGTPCKAQDVVRSINRVMKISGDPSWLVTDFVEKVEAIDDTEKAHILLLSLSCNPTIFPSASKLQSKRD